jgi:vitamin B12 transporter
MRLANAVVRARTVSGFPTSRISDICCLLPLCSMLICASANLLAGDPEEGETVLRPIMVTGIRVANPEPASSYAAVATALRYDPQLDLQSRGLAEGQADISVRGGVFENTGFRIGAVSIFDPQTGHYSVELPIAPGLLSPAEILTDADNSLAAFNAAVATVHYQLAALQPGGLAQAGFGNDSLLHGSLVTAFGLGEPGSTSARNSTLGFAAAASRGDGTVAFGDHDFKRFSAQYQYLRDDATTSVLLGYQDKFFGWPGAYTGFASLPETDHTKLGLLLLDHRRELSQGWWQVTAAYRWLDDNYDFDRRTPDLGGPGSFEHKTRNVALGLAGELRGDKLDWRFSAQVSADHLVDSTDLTGGDFSSRNYLNLAVVPQKSWGLASDAALIIRGGLRADFSSRDENAWSPVAGIRWEQDTVEQFRWISLEYTEQTQLPGYTALKSPPRGLFGGNPDLGREYADTLTLSAGFEVAQAWIKAAIFQRRDDDLVDWTYRQSAPSVRQANPVDLEVNGLELVAGWQSQQLDLVAAITLLDKDEDYGSTAVDASYYALNYARQRYTLALIYRPWESLELRLDNEYRKQQENSLRPGSDKAYLGALSLNWQTPLAQNLALSLVIDNFTDEDFQEFPGTPAAGRQFSINAVLDW